MRMECLQKQEMLLESWEMICPGIFKNLGFVSYLEHRLFSSLWVQRQRDCWNFFSDIAMSIRHGSVTGTQSLQLLQKSRDSQGTLDQDFVQSELHMHLYLQIKE